MGVYINTSEYNPHSCTDVFNFWKKHVSFVYKQEAMMKSRSKGFSDFDLDISDFKKSAGQPKSI